MSSPKIETPVAALNQGATSGPQRLGLADAAQVRNRGQTRTGTDLVLDARGLWQGPRMFSDLATWAADRQTHSEVNEGSRHPVRVHIAGELLHEWTCDPALPLPHDAARLAWAKRLQEQYHGSEAAGWPQAVWSGRGHGVTAWQCASATGGEPLRAWRALARGKGISIASVMPLWRAALLHARAHHVPLVKALHGSLLVVEGALLTHIVLARGKPVSVTRRRLPQPDRASLRAFVDGLPQPRPGCCVVVGGGLAAEPAGLLGSRPPAGPQPDSPMVELGELSAALPWIPPATATRSWHSAAIRGPDFMRPGRPANPWPWLAVATGVAMLAFVAWEAQGVRALELAGVGASEARQAQTMEARARHPRASALHFPWPAVLQSMESTAVPGLHWTQLTADAQGRVAAQGRAESDTAVRELARRLQATQVWRDVTVARSEVAVPGWQFEISARIASTATAP